MIKQRLKQLAKDEADHLFTLKPKVRPWYVGVVAALTIASTIFFGALFGELPTGVLASLGAMIFLNQPASGNVRQRQKLLFLLGVVMVSSFSLGLVAHNIPIIRMPLFAFICFSMVIMGRYLRLLPPGGMFILMASVIAIFMPVGWAEMPTKIAVVAAGSLYAWLVSLFYNLWIVRPDSKPVATNYRYERGLLTESIIVSAFVVLALEVALWLDMPYPYWVPVSSYIIMQGMQLRTMWIKQLHRILGTAIGVVVAWFLLSLSLSEIGVAVAIFMMFVWIETIITRHYALAVIMITPLTIFIAEYGGGSPELSSAASGAYQAIVQARFLDTLLGCVIALLGGVVMHSTWLRKPLVTLEAKLFKKYASSN